MYDFVVMPKVLAPSGSSSQAYFLTILIGKILLRRRNSEDDASGFCHEGFYPKGHGLGIVIRLNASLYRQYGSEDIWNKFASVQDWLLRSMSRNFRLPADLLALDFHNGTRGEVSSHRQVPRLSQGETVRRHTSSSLP